MNRSMEQARQLGAAAGAPGAVRLWSLSKHELLEAALSLAGRVDAPEVTRERAIDLEAVARARLEQEITRLKDAGRI